MRSRRADVVADEASCCRVLSRFDVERQRRDHPETAVELLMVVASERGVRLARTSDRLTGVEHL